LLTCDGPFLDEISHQRVTADDGRGNRAMKNWNESAGDPEIPKALASSAELPQPCQERGFSALRPPMTNEPQPPETILAAALEITRH
jgi:hypothetical protein